MPAAAIGAGGWGAPATISGDDAGRPRVSMSAGGDATAAWSGGAGVLVSTRPRGRAFGPPRVLSSDPSFLLDLVGDPDGDVTATWVSAGPAVESAWGSAAEFRPRVPVPFQGLPAAAAAPRR